MEDTVTLARQEREKQGPWEVEVSYGGEADLHRHEAGCDKNPGHKKFVPVDQFNVGHLPPGCQDNDLVDLVRAMADLTVRVSVKYVSEGRPETDPESGRRFPCYKDMDSNMMRLGTGWVRWLTKFPVEMDDRYATCPCHECLISPTPKTQFARILIETAAHVVYDSLEAAHTTCHLFFDKGGTPLSCSGVVALCGGSVETSRVDADWCQMTFVTHDLDLVDRLDQMVNHMETLRARLREKLGPPAEKQKSLSPRKDLIDALDNQCKRLKEKFDQLETEKEKSSLAEVEMMTPDKFDTFIKSLKDTFDQLDTEKQNSPSPAEDLPDAVDTFSRLFMNRFLDTDEQKPSSAEDRTEPWDDLNIIVSHPHGCSKQVSVGYYVDMLERCGRMYPRTYTTATCPGSSGARVWSVKDRDWRRYRSYGIVHCGQYERNTDLNFCNTYLD